MPAAPSSPTDATPRVLTIACGALVRELRAVSDLNGWGHIDATYLPANLHNRPERIAPRVIEAVNDAIEGAEPTYERVVIGYGDCGTGGHLDRAIDELRRGRPDVEFRRLPGDHCYEFLTGTDRFQRIHGAELGTLFLTDYLARHFDVLLWQGLGLDENPELIPMLFANYRRVVLLLQTDDPDKAAELRELGEAAAASLGLDFEVVETGLTSFAQALRTTGLISTVTTPHAANEADSPTTTLVTLERTPTAEEGP